MSADLQAPIPDGHHTTAITAPAPRICGLDVKSNYAEHATMNSSAWDNIFNILLLLFWFRIWTWDDRQLYFNPYLAMLTRVSDQMLTILRPVFRGINPRLVPAMAILFLLIMRAIAFSVGSQIVIGLGFERGMPESSGIISCLVFSALSFLSFLFMLWSLALVYVWNKSDSFSDHTENTLNCIARPFTGLKPEWRPVALLAAGTLLSAAVAIADSGRISPGFRGSGVLNLLARFTISSLAGWTNFLMVVHSLSIMLIIGSWISMFMASHNLRVFCDEWLSFLMGPLRRYPLRIGMFDLTPLIFIIGIGLIHPKIMYFLYLSWVKMV